MSTQARTKLICTLGPATESAETIGALMDAGADVFRLNMSHAKHEWAREMSRIVRKQAKDRNAHIAVLFDLTGPSIRTGDLTKPYELKEGDLVEFRKTDTAATIELSTTVNYGGLMDDVSEGNTLVVDNGAMLMLIKSVRPDSILCEVKTPGKLGSRRHINLPGVRLNLPALTEKDHADLAPDGHPAGIATLEFRHVDFAYTDGEPVLKDFNLTVQAGQTIALVGASGGGKSTIVNLAARFYEPTGGKILVNGHDLRDRGLAWYQSNLGIVLQGPHLFSGSVRENIRYGRLDATDEEIEQAARSVNADAFIRALEDGYDTDVGEGGNRLSTGQKQLVSFARALLANPRIFIMDEATSSIDTETEQLIQQGLKAIFQGRISFVIAHRLSTIRTADRILVIEKGHILESGTHQELLAKKGHYHALYTHQFQQEREASLFGKLG